MTAPTTAARRPWVSLVSGLSFVAVVAAGLGWVGHDSDPTALASTSREEAASHDPAAERSAPEPARPAAGTVTLAFAGDTHFQLGLAALLDHPGGALGPITLPLRAADLSMVNLESAIGHHGAPDPKERETSAERYWFRTSPEALDVLAAAGVDVVTMANNHGADYGAAGFADTLRARRNAPLDVIGVGRNRRDAFTPYRETIRGTRIAVLAADASFREGMSRTWAAGAATAGIAAAHARRPATLLSAVRRADRGSDVVVVYLHWGTAMRACPDPRQRDLAAALSAAGADVIVGAHAHVLLGAGWLGDTYVDYGLGNFLWYHNREPETGVLRLTLRDRAVVGGSWTPARIRVDGRPAPLHGKPRADAVAEWDRLRDCTGLTASRGAATIPPYSWSERRIGALLRERMRPSYHPGCPVPLRDLRYLRMRYLGFDGRPHLGEMVIHEDDATRVAAVFRRLYDAQWPIRRMRLVDDYGGDDDRSMTADNTSGFNCRRVAGRQAWSAHAYGTAIDITPVENPDLVGASVAPRAGRRFAAVDRSADARPAPGVITADGPVVRAFARAGWAWGGTWALGRDYQHFSDSG